MFLVVLTVLLVRTHIWHFYDALLTLFSFQGTADVTGVDRLSDSLHMLSRLFRRVNIFYLGIYCHHYAFWLLFPRI